MRSRPTFGFTLIELLVSVAVLAIIILMVSDVMVQTQRTVSLAEDVIHCTANARLVADVLRNDLHQISHEAFLVITCGVGPGPSGGADQPDGWPIAQTAQGWWPPYDSLLFVTLDPTLSNADDNYITHSNGRMIDYSIAHATVGYHLFRRAQVIPYGQGNSTGYADLFPLTLDRCVQDKRGIANRLLQYNTAWATTRTPPYFVPGDKNGTWTYSNGTAYGNRVLPGWIVPYGMPNGAYNAGASWPEYFDPVLDAQGHYTYDASGRLICYWDFQHWHIQTQRLRFPYASDYDSAWNWALLMPYCTVLSVEWTDGSREDDGVTVRWFNSRNPHDLAAGDPRAPHLPPDPTDPPGSWEDKDWQYQQTHRAEAAPEFKLPLPVQPDMAADGRYASGYAYCAMWTRDDAQWPKALRVRFGLKYGTASQVHEVVVSLDR